MIQRRNNNKSYQGKSFDKAKNKLYQRVKAGALIAGTLPLSRLSRRFLSISQSTHCCHQHTNTNRDNANETIVIVTDKIWSAVNCPIKVGIVPISWLLKSCLSISQSTMLSHKHEQSQRKRENCYRHWQVLERSQLSDKGRNRATQLVVVEPSVDFTKHTLL